MRCQWAPPRLFVFSLPVFSHAPRPRAQGRTAAGTHTVRMTLPPGCPDLTFLIVLPELREKLPLPSAEGLSLMLSLFVFSLRHRQMQRRRSLIEVTKRNR